MKIYPQEIERGLQQKILASNIVTAHCPVRQLKNPKRVAEALAGYQKYKASAAYNDLYWAQ